MKKMSFFVMLSVLIMLLPSPANAQVAVDVRITVPMPPPIAFTAPPTVVVIPGTYVYAVPDIREEIFFHGGWWWRLWEGRWYRSRYYDRGWAHYGRVPAFYTHVPHNWRTHYHERIWKGQEWEQQRISHHELEKNWRGWEKRKYWEREHNWGVKRGEHGKHAPKHGHPSQYRERREETRAKEADPQERREGQEERRWDRERDRGREK